MKALIIDSNLSSIEFLEQILTSTGYFSEILKIGSEEELLSVSSSFNDISVVVATPSSSGAQDSSLLQVIESLFAKAKLFVFSIIPPIGFSKLQWLPQKLSHSELAAIITSMAVSKNQNIKPTKAPSNIYEGLSSRATEVFNLIGKGVSNKDIAGKLGIAPSTVNVYVRALKSYLGVSNRIEIALAHKTLIDDTKTPSIHTTYDEPRPLATLSA